MDDALLSPPSGRRVLVIDDEPAILRAVTRLLRGNQVESAPTADDAVRRFETGDLFDLVFCDVMMPGGSGLQLYRMVAARFPDTAERFVFITGGLLSTEDEAFLNGIPNRCLKKPFDPIQMRKLVADTPIRR